MTQANLGNVLFTLGERESGTARLEQAVAAYRAALEERTRDRVPLDWAGTTYILGYTEALIGGRVADRGRVLEGIARIESAIPVLKEGGHAGWAESARNYLEKARAILASLPGP
jgi:tetratricopeptide (TPR) repeat protein